MRKIKLNKDTEMTVDVIKYILDIHKEEAKRINKLKDYYNNNNDIIYRQYNNGNKPKNKIANPYASYITNTAVGYFLGKPVSYTNIDSFEAIKDLLVYNDEADNNTTIAKMSSICGYGIEIMYVDKDTNIRFVSIDPSECAVVYDNTLQENIIFAIRYYDEKIIDTDNTITHVEVYDKNNITYYIKEYDSIRFIDQVPHYFLDVPVSVYINNDERFGDFEKIKPLIDAYDKTQSDSANDFESFTHAYLVISGYLMDEESAKDIENQNIINFTDNEGKAEYLIKNIQDSALENYKNRLDNDIHRFSCVPNMSDEKFYNNSSGVALSYKLMSLENLVGIKEAKFKKGLLRRLELMCNFLKIKTNSEMSYMEIQPIFTRNKPYNDTEIADTMQKLTGILSEETILALSPYVDDVSSELERKKNEANALYEDNYSELGEINAEEE
ncbi:MAG: phage portal protein [Romboutsia sp.]|nr:phage portal protein [Romboutsia sp.]